MHTPIAPRRPYVHTEHGVQRPDPWHWLREREDPEVIAYIEAENAYMRETTGHIDGLHKALFEEMKASIQQTDQSAPVERRGFWYYTRTVEGLSYGIYCRRKGTMDAPEQILLDENALAAAHAYTSVNTIAVSPDQRWMAYSVDHTGRELFDVVVVDLDSGETVDTALTGTDGDLTWAMDNQTLIYGELDEALRPWRLLRHRVGTEGPDPVILEEPDPRFRLYCSRTSSDAYLAIGAISSTTTEMHVIPASTPEVAPRCLEPRTDGIRYGIEHHPGRFFIHTNADGAVNFKLMEMPEQATGRAEWVEVIGHRPEVQLVGTVAFKDHLVLFERENGLAHLHIRDLATGDGHRIALPEPVYDIGFESNPNFDSRELRFSYDSMVTPPTVFAYDMASRERRTLKVTAVLGGYEPTDFRTERFTAPSTDGAHVPISIVYPADFPRDGSGKLLLYGYGSYGLTIDASFVHSRLPLLKRGVAYAIAHLRGGGLLGRPWYESGKMEHKQHTFDDFIAAGRYLQRENWTRADRMAIMGGSAGGLLMGAVMNQAPELATCCVAAVPFVDVVNTMLDESLPLTANEWEEWGNPRERAAFDRMLAYSPYDNVVDQAYPDLLITSGLNDPRVQYWEPTKWCAKLRATVSAPRELVLKTHMGAGHQGQSGRYGHLDDRAFDYAWLLDKLGITA